MGFERQTVRQMLPALAITRWKTNPRDFGAAIRPPHLPFRDVAHLGELVHLLKGIHDILRIIVQREVQQAPDGMQHQSDQPLFLRILGIGCIAPESGVKAASGEDGNIRQRAGEGHRVRGQLGGDFHFGDDEQEVRRALHFFDDAQLQQFQRGIRAARGDEVRPDEVRNFEANIGHLFSYQALKHIHRVHDGLAKRFAGLLYRCDHHADDVLFFHTPTSVTLVCWRLPIHVIFYIMNHGG